MFEQDSEFVAGTLDDPLQLADETGIHRVVGRLERFDGLFAAADEDAEKRGLPVYGVRLDGLDYRATRRPKPLLLL